MVHLKYKKIIAILCLAAFAVSCFAGCKVTVEDGGYQGKIVDELTEPTNETTEATGTEQVLVPTDGAIGTIVNGPADVYDAADGKVISSLEDGAKVITIERTVEWFHIQEGWVKAEFVSLEPVVDEEKGTAGFVNANEVNVRSGPGTDNGIVSKAYRNDLLLITETEEDANKLKWGKYDKGWICMDYVTTDLFGVEVLVIQDKTQEMGMPGEGGLINEHNYGDWFTVRATQVIEGVIWGKVGDGWIDLSRTKLSTYDAKNLEGTWRNYESYNSWTFDPDGYFVYSAEDYELSGDKLTMKGNAKTKEGAYIYDGRDLYLYYMTADGKKTSSSVYTDDMPASFAEGKLILNNSKDPLIKGLTPQEIYDKNNTPTSDPEAVAWITGSWLYFSSMTTAEDGTKTALGNVVTFTSDGSFAITAYTFTGTVAEDSTVTWTCSAGSSTSGTYIYDGTDMVMTSNGVARTVKMPKNTESGSLINASGLEQIMASGNPDGTVGQTMRKASATDDASLCAQVATIFA